MDDRTAIRIRKTALTPISLAQKTLVESLALIDEQESTQLRSAAGRILARDYYSDIDVPPLNNSAMDGYAVLSGDLKSQATSLKVTQRIAAGQKGEQLSSGEAARIFTGAPLPKGADAVVMQENCQVEKDSIKVFQKVQPGENLRLSGEDIKAGELLLNKGRRLLAQDIGLLASIGLTQLDVVRQIRVALMTTGDELIHPGGSLKAGQIYNSNFYTLASLLEALGAKVIDLGVVEDDLQGTKRALVAASDQADCVITTGGVSVGEEDHVKAAVEAMGYLDLWKLAIKPGKPFASGKLIRANNSSVQFFGLPGNPVSAFVTFVLLVRPALLAMQGCRESAPKSFHLPTGFSCQKTAERQEYLRVIVVAGVNQSALMPYDNQSSGVAASLSYSEGLAIVPPYSEIAIGDSLEYIPFSELLN
jgi:molybdopterin molybdotransferase